MRRLLLLLLCLLTVPVSAQAPIIGPTDAIGFDYLNDDFTTYSVDRFEASYDNGAWSSLGIPQTAGTLNGVTTYKMVPPMTNGNHTVGFRACNAVGCSTSSAPFAFALGAPSAAPGNVRKIPR